MRCACGGLTICLESRMMDREDAHVRRRRRRCHRCGAIFHTFESTVDPAKFLRLRASAAAFERRRRAALTPEQRAEESKRNRLRAEARVEARESGEPVAAVYERWGV